MVVEVTGSKRDVLVRSWVSVLDCLVTFVALDEERRPVQVPDLESNSADADLEAWARRRRELTQEWSKINDEVDTAGADGLPDNALGDSDTSREILSMGETTVNLRKMFMPYHLNPGGTVFGGDVLEWMEGGALTSAINFTRNEHMTTIALDRLTFLKPINAGDFVELSATVSFCTEHTVHVDVEMRIANNPGEQVHTHTGHFVILNHDAIGNKRPVTIGLRLDTDEERIAYEKARRRHVFWQEHEKGSSPPRPRRRKGCGADSE